LTFALAARCCPMDGSEGVRAVGSDLWVQMDSGDVNG
jgi:hypothetical protein